ncbi:MAG: hypothetical protein NTY19_08880, partial [Planctomycetota bacterium]|nr:hypothetical protein [Planctomycetota bacterium]
LAVLGMNEAKLGQILNRTGHDVADKGRILTVPEFAAIVTEVLGQNAVPAFVAAGLMPAGSAISALVVADGSSVSNGSVNADSPDKGHNSAEEWRQTGTDTSPSIDARVGDMTGAQPSTTKAVGLTDESLQPIVTEAVSRWVNAGLDGRVLNTLRVTRTVITDLPGSELGLAAGSTIYIDQDAAGHGWFVDPTPSQDEEFTAAQGGELVAITPDAAARMDLLTVVEHELGHAAGLTDGPARTADVMSATLPTGVRRVPTVAETPYPVIENSAFPTSVSLRAVAIPVATDTAAVSGEKWSVVGVEGLLPQPSINQSIVSVLETHQPLPANLEFGITFQTSRTDADWNSQWADAMLIFDYKGPTDYKFAGAFVGINTWAIGRMTERGYMLDRTVSEELQFGKDYRLQLHLTGKSASLAADGVEKLRYTFADDIQAGQLGVSTWNRSSRFDDLSVEEV